MELKFVSREGDFLIFEAPDGSRMQTLLDDSLRDAIRRNHVVETSGFTPKDVQSLIRSGSTVEQVAEKFGVPSSAVEPFALPILDELKYVLETALNTSLADGPSMKRFEDIVLAFDPGALFSVSKSEDGWVVTAKGSDTYTWLFNPKARLLEPSNAAARKIGKHPAVRDAIFEAPAVPVAEIPEETPSASVHDLVQELRSRRQAPAEIKPQTAKGRASLPSWDEIVLGASHLEADPN